MTNNDNLIIDVMKFDAELRGSALKMTKNLADAEDLVQDTYAKVIQYSYKYSPDTNLKAWVFTIMRNTFINGYRRRQNSKVFSEDLATSGYENTSFDPADSADLHYYVSEINNKISTLDPEQRKPFEMFVDGYKYQEIAEYMQLPIGTVKSRIHFIRQKLMHELHDYRDIA